MFLGADKAQSPASKYLLAQCCVRLGKMNEAEHALAVLPGEQVIPDRMENIFVFCRHAFAKSMKQ